MKIGNLIENILKVSTEIPIFRYSEIAAFEISVIINQTDPVYICAYTELFLLAMHINIFAIYSSCRNPSYLGLQFFRAEESSSCEGKGNLK